MAESDSSDVLAAHFNTTKLETPTEAWIKATCEPSADRMGERLLTPLEAVLYFQ